MGPDEFVPNGGRGGEQLRRDVIVGAVALVAVVLWELTGADLAVSSAVGGPGGFPLRDAWLLRDVLHDGARWIAAGAVCWLVVDAWRPPVGGPTAAERRRALAATLAILLAIPAAKRFSGTSCPWDLWLFGGAAAYVPHWLPGVGDEGPGHCFPAGHPVAALAFVPLYFTWRVHRPGWARSALAVALGAGALLGGVQVVRGAHFVSHVLWSAWLAWAIAAVSAALPPRAPAPPHAAPPPTRDRPARNARR
jgi:membrane-associated PAP2 superfamily phosphatase